MKSARPWRYSSAISIDESHSVPADPEKQHFSVLPESAYYSMQLRCEQCGEEFWFSANEQKTWYEEWGFWIDSVPKQCTKCRKLKREQNDRANKSLQPTPDGALVSISNFRSGVAEIDDAILAVALPRWQKVAMIILETAEQLGRSATDGDDHYHFYAERIKVLVQAGRLVAQGDVTNWRFSEVRLP